jgi:hypothetical protein
VIDLLYIDPGSGSYLAQVIIASILGVVFYFRNILHIIRNFFGRFTGSKNRHKEQ